MQDEPSLVRDLAADKTFPVPVAVACRVLGFPRQAFYAWDRNPVSDRDLADAYLTNAALDVHADDPEFGYRFVADELAAAGHVASERRVWRLCSQARIFSAHSRRRGTAKRPGPPVHDDLVQRDFTAMRRTSCGSRTSPSTTPTRGSSTSARSPEGKDAFSARIVGYSIDSRMKTRIAVAALSSAVPRRGGPAAGSQFRSRRFVEELKHQALTGSMGRVGAAGDNAATEILVSVSSGHRSSFEESKEVSGVVALEASHGLSLGLAFGDSAGDVVIGRLVVLGPRQDHGVKCPVELTVAAA